MTEETSFEPSEADIRDMAIMLHCGFEDSTYARSKEYFGDEGPQHPWTRMAELVFEHPGYIPTVLKARLESNRWAENLADILDRNAAYYDQLSNRNSELGATNERLTDENAALKRELARLHDVLGQPEAPIIKPPAETRNEAVLRAIKR